MTNVYEYINTYRIRETKAQRKLRAKAYGLEHYKIKQATRLRKANHKSLDQALKCFQEKLIRKATPSELQFKEILNRLNFKYQFQKIFKSKNKSYITDFYLTEYHTVVEIDGGYHSTTKQTGKDIVRALCLGNKTTVGKLVRFTNNEVITNKDNLQFFINRLFIEINVL